MARQHVISGAAAALGLVLAGVLIVVGTRPTSLGHSGHVEAASVDSGSGSSGAPTPGHDDHPTPSETSTTSDIDHADAHPEVAVAAPGAYDQTREAVLAVLAASGPADALAELDRLIQVDPSVSGICHAVAHDLGHASLAMVGGDASLALNDRDDVCGGGYTHGVIEIALGASTNVKRDLLTICAPAQDGSCFHGVGHGLMFATDMNPRKALKLCDLAPSWTLAHRCAEGVYMQLFSGDIAAAHAAGADLPTLVEARAECSTTRTTYAANCWFYAPNVWLAQNPDDFLGAMDWCRGADGEVGLATCIRGTGSRAVKYHPDDLSIAESVCATAGANRRDCVGGMASYWSVHWKGEVPRSDLCERLEKRRLAKICRQVT